MRDADDDTLAISTSRSRSGLRKRLLCKASKGRGQKRSDWVSWLYPLLLESFETYKKAGVKFSSKLLIELALSILLSLDSIYTNQSRDPKDNKLLHEKLTYTWMHQFMDAHNIVLLSQTGRLTCSTEKETEIERQTAYHLGVMQRGFHTGLFHKDLMENIDEAHFVVNMDNGRTLGFRNDSVVKYADVVSGGDCMTVVIRISGRHRSLIETPMIIFTNAGSNYPIRGLPDNIPGVTYRTGPKGWMSQRILVEYFLEPRTFQPDLHNRTSCVAR